MKTSVNMREVASTTHTRLGANNKKLEEARCFLLSHVRKVPRELSSRTRITRPVSHRKQGPRPQDIGNIVSMAGDSIWSSLSFSRRPRNMSNEGLVRVVPVVVQATFGSQVWRLLEKY